ncbi:MAG: hypothetical protein K6F32_05045 [Bacilli bacterium]|nr:hypothetical protein [Bacilli bacterium]
MAIYQRRIKILTEHADFTRRLKLAELLKFAQELSIAHTTELGAGREKTLDKGLLWVVGRQHFEIVKIPLYDEHVLLESWPGETRFFFLPRFYEFSDEDTHEVLVRGTAVWSLIDEKTRMPIVPGEHDIFIPEEKTGREIDLPLGFRIPELKEEAEFEVRYSDADLNGHLNNTAYLNKVMDLIPTDYLKAHEPKALDVQYKKEIKLGETITLSYGLVDSSWWFSCEKFMIKIEFH